MDRRPGSAGGGTLPVMARTASSASVRDKPATVESGEEFAAEVFDAIASHLGKRAEAIALFTETGGSFEQWCTWEGLAACRAKGWTVRPQPRVGDNA